MTVTFTDGESSTSTCLSAIGGPDRPLDDQQVLDKIAMMTLSSTPTFGGAAHALVHDRGNDSRPWADVLGDLIGRVR